MSRKEDSEDASEAGMNLGLFLPIISYKYLVGIVVCLFLYTGILPVSVKLFSMHSFSRRIFQFITQRY